MENTTHSKQQSGVNIDGFIRQGNRSAAIQPPKRRQPAATVTKKPLPTQTLMRSAVKKPAKTDRPIKSAAGALQLASPKVQLPTMAGNINHGLSMRSQSFRKSTKITRYGAPLPPAPTQLAKPVTPAASLYQPARDLPKAAPRAASKDDVFNAALMKAKSHEQQPLTKKELKKLQPEIKHWKKHLIPYMATAVLAIAIGGYGIYSGLPTVMIKVASIRAGFAAVLPSYRPSGFSLSRVQYGQGKVMLNYTSNIDGRHFSISEQPSVWDSATLVSSVVVPASSNHYQQLMIDGQTVYLFGNNQASWVNNGVWYQVSGANGLSLNDLEQLVKTL